jgi:hypothetical protein
MSINSELRGMMPGEVNAIETAKDDIAGDPFDLKLWA